MDSLSMRSIKRKRVFLNIAKQARLIIDEKNGSIKNEIQNEINNAIRNEQLFLNKNNKSSLPSKDLKALTDCICTLRDRFSAITKKSQLNKEEITELKELIRTAKEISFVIKSKKKKSKIISPLA